MNILRTKAAISDNFWSYLNQLINYTFHLNLNINFEYTNE
jgi:hypothetical protein